MADSIWDVVKVCSVCQYKFQPLKPDVLKIQRLEEVAPRLNPVHELCTIVLCLSFMVAVDCSKRQHHCKVLYALVVLGKV